MPGAGTRDGRFRSATLFPLGAQGGGRHLEEATPRRPARMCHTQAGPPSDPGTPAFSETPVSWDPSPAPAPPPGSGTPARPRDPSPAPGSQSGPGSPARPRDPSPAPGPPPGSRPLPHPGPRPALGPLTPEEPPAARDLRLAVRPSPSPGARVRAGGPRPPPHLRPPQGQRSLLAGGRPGRSRRSRAAGRAAAAAAAATMEPRGGAASQPLQRVPTQESAPAPQEQRPPRGCDRARAPRRRTRPARDTMPRPWRLPGVRGPPPGQ